MSEHTPGPWRAETNGAGYWDIRTRQRGIASIIPFPGTPSLDKANARLIAAAPDLLEALRALLKDGEDLTQASQWGEHLEQASAAIAKAIGEE